MPRNEAPHTNPLKHPGIIQFYQSVMELNQLIILWYYFYRKNQYSL